MKKLILLVVLLNSVSKAQIDLNYFYASQQNNSVRLNWEITRGSVCNGILIQRAGKELLFTTIGEIDGVCGSPDVEQQFEFTDENPVAFSTNYYRLVAGSVLLNDTVKTDFHYVKNNFFIENPVTNESVLYLDNENKNTIVITDLTGKILVHTVLNSSLIQFKELHCCIDASVLIIKVISENGDSSVQKLIKSDL